MLKAKCIQKFRDKNNIIKGYRLQDERGNTMDVNPYQLKIAIKQGKIDITNLILTSDNRLIDKMESMFDNCSSLKPLDLSNFDTEKVTNMCEMFRDCTFLGHLDLTKFDTKDDIV